MRDEVSLRGRMAPPPKSVPPDVSERILERAAVASDSQSQPEIPPYRMTSVLRHHWATIFAVCFVAGILTGIFQSHIRKRSASIDAPDDVAYVLNFPYNID